MRIYHRTYQRDTQTFSKLSLGRAKGPTQFLQNLSLVSAPSLPYLILYLKNDSLRNFFTPLIIFFLILEDILHFLNNNIWEIYIYIINTSLNKLLVIFFFCKIFLKIIRLINQNSSYRNITIYIKEKYLNGSRSSL